MYFKILPVGALRLHGVDYGCHSTVKNKSSSGKMKLISFCRKFIVDKGNWKIILKSAKNGLL